MDIVQIKTSHKNTIYKLAVEENKVLREYASHPIYQVNFSKTLFETLFNSYFQKNHFFYGIKQDGRIIAIISGYIKQVANGNIGYIDNMFVLKRYTRKGYATILRNEFFKWLKSKKINYCQLEVLNKNPAKNIYKKWGFRIDGFQMTKRI